MLENGANTLASPVMEHNRFLGLLEEALDSLPDGPERARLLLEEIYSGLALGWLTPGPVALERLHREPTSLGAVPGPLLAKWYRELDPLGQGRLIHHLVAFHGSLRRVSSVLGLSTRRLDQILHLCRLGPEWETLLKAGASEWHVRVLRRASQASVRGSGRTRKGSERAEGY